MSNGQLSLKSSGELHLACVQLLATPSIARLLRLVIKAIPPRQAVICSDASASVKLANA